MLRLNENYLKLPGSYLFSEIARRVSAFQQRHSERPLIRLGIGDVTRPLVPAVIRALHEAVDEQASAEGFRGYGPEQGYAFLREAVVRHDFAARGVAPDPDEIFVSDGAKCDVGNFQELFGPETLVAVTDPVYPVYVDSNVMAGRAGELGPDGRWSGLLYLPCTAENHFVPDLPERRPDVLYLCLPNNPTGGTLTRGQLQRFVDYARENECLILFDAAYEAYIREDDVPHSIYELEGARDVAVEFRSLSKTAGFTGLRCAYTVVPKGVTARTADGKRVALNPLWNRRQTTKYNGCPYIVQKAAAAVFSEEGRRQTQACVQAYLDNAALIRAGFAAAGLPAYGGVNAPYVWIKTPDASDSWTFFDRLLQCLGIVGTPGAGFGPSGEGYFRLTGFGSPEATREAVRRLAAAGHWSEWPGASPR